MPEVYTKDGPVWREADLFDPETAALPSPAPAWKRALVAVRTEGRRTLYRLALSEARHGE